jgi:hypothetical protein
MPGAGVSQLSWQGLYQGEKEMLDLMLYICYSVVFLDQRQEKNNKATEKRPKIKMNII